MCRFTHIAVIQIHNLKVLRIPINLFNHPQKNSFWLCLMLSQYSHTKKYERTDDVFTPIYLYTTIYSHFCDQTFTKVCAHTHTYTATAAAYICKSIHIRLRTAKDDDDGETALCVCVCHFAIFSVFNILRRTRLSSLLSLSHRRLIFLFSPFFSVSRAIVRVSTVDARHCYCCRCRHSFYTRTHIHTNSTVVLLPFC